MKFIEPEEIFGEERGAWFRLTPAERWAESAKLWATYLAMGGSLDPDPDPNSPFFDAEEWRANFADGRPGLHIIRRGGI
jgi:hypothetical protein